MPDPSRRDAGPAPAQRPARRGLRRAASQAGLALALLAVLAVCAAAAGTGALLLTAGHARALSAAVAQADGDEQDGGPDLATVIVSGAATPSADPVDAATLLPLVRRSLSEAAAPYPAQVSLWTATELLYLGGDEVRRGYLLEADTLAGNARLRAGQWPTPAGPADRIPVAVSSTTAAALGAGPGTELALAPSRQDGEPGGYRLVVSGVFEPDRSAAWDRDTLRGRGYEPSYLSLPAFGPFVVAPGTLEGLAAPVDRVVAVLDPDLAGDAGGVPALAERVAALATGLADTAGVAIGPVRVWSGLGAAFAAMEAELAVTDALVLGVLVLILALGVATTALLAQVLAGRRGGPSARRRPRGASSRQRRGPAAAEAFTLAGAAAALAAPLAVLGYRASAPAAGTAALTPPTLELVLALLAGAAIPATVLVLVPLRERSRARTRAVPGALARSGLDLMLVAVAVVAYLQLRAHVPTPRAADPLLVIAPAICVLAAASLTTRLVPLVARAADSAARRGRSIVAPLAAWHVARGGATRGMFLIVLAAAVATLGVTAIGTWTRSQAEQAAASVGADLVLADPGGPGTARDLAALTGGTVAPVADRAVVLGARPDGVRVLALDSRLAGPVLAGRPPSGQTWPDVIAPLAPREPGAALAWHGVLPDVTLTGGLRTSAPMDGLPVPAVTATPTLVLADEAGATTTRTGSAVLLDGRPHRVDFAAPGQPGLPPGAWQLVAIDLLLADRTTDADLIAWGNQTAAAEVSLKLAGASSPGTAWDAAGEPGEGAVRAREVTVRGDTVSASFGYPVLAVSWQSARLTLLSFPATTDVPVALTEDLAAELDLTGGDRVALTWGTTTLTAEVAGTVGYVPGQVRRDALLADLASLRRALLSGGNLQPATDAWWVGSPRPGAAAALRESDRGSVTDRAAVADALQAGPLRVTLPTAWGAAVAAAIGFAVAGSAAGAAAEAQRRATTLARVRALGLSRRAALASHLGQHAAVTIAGVALGGLCGAVLAVVLVPLLVLAPTGERAIPAVALVWPAGSLTATLAALAVGGVLAGVPAGLAVASRSTVAALRAGDAP